MATGTIFDNNRTQAVRLPSEVRFPSNVKKVEVLAVGRTRILVPAGASWDAWFDGEGVTTDFMPDREQPHEQVRESF